MMEKTLFIRWSRRHAGKENASRWKDFDHRSWTQASSIKDFSLESSNFHHNAADPGAQPGAAFVSVFPLPVYPSTFQLL